MRALSASCFRLEQLSDGETAWFQGGTETYDRIVLDLSLPKLDGLSVLKRWWAEGVTTPVLVLTARGAWTERVEGIDAGADDYLPKLFRMEKLRARALVLPPTELLDHLYGDEDSRETNALEAIIVRIRRKLGPGIIGTRRGFGYFLEGAD